MKKREILAYFSSNIIVLYWWGWILEATYLKYWLLQDQRRALGHALWSRKSVVFTICHSFLF